MKQVLSRLFYAGFIRLHILHHADEAPICGVEIVEELGHHGYRLSPGTVYPVLHELVRAGYLKVRTKVVGGKVRKYYTATAAGHRALVKAREKLRELAGEVLDHEPSKKSK
ncbi:MAG TPA: PadR family transcriptional regulator [Gemmataceae bacterium]|nr:PadR family transcriptional regulator [Gemmataceae bacterium]